MQCIMKTPTHNIFLYSITSFQYAVVAGIVLLLVEIKNVIVKENQIKFSLILYATKKKKQIGCDM